MTTRLAYLSAALAAALFAGSIQLAGPQSGMVFDAPSKSVRPITGVPGAAYLGAPIADGIDLAAVSPNGKFVVAAKGGALQLLRINVDQPVWETLEPESGPIGNLAWSEDSTSVVVAGTELRLWRRLDTTPERLALANVDGAAWSAFAVEAGAEAVLASGGSGVYLLSGSEARLVADLESPGAIALSSDGALYAADRAGKRILAIRNWRGAADVTPLATGIEDPMALAMAQDRRSLLVASGDSRLLLQLDSGTGLITERWELDFAPTRIERLSSGVYVLNARGPDTPSLQLLTGGSQPAVYFVPAAGADSQED